MQQSPWERGEASGGDAATEDAGASRGHGTHVWFVPVGEDLTTFRLLNVYRSGACTCNNNLAKKIEVLVGIVHVLYRILKNKILKVGSL